MDILCPRCGEPWDNDTIHDEVSVRREVGEPADYHNVAAEFRLRGCHTFRESIGPVVCKENDSQAAVTAGVLYDLLGDDMDGAASMLADLGL